MSCLNVLTTASAQQIEPIGQVISNKCTISCYRAVTANSCATVAKLDEILGGQQMDDSLYTRSCNCNHAF